MKTAKTAVRNVGGLIDLAVLDTADGRWLTKADLAERFAVTERTVSNWIARGWLRAYRLGSSVRIDPKDVEKFLEARKTNDEEER